MESATILVICCPECENYEDLEILEDDIMVCPDCNTAFDIDNIAATQITIEKEE